MDRSRAEEGARQEDHDDLLTHGAHSSQRGVDSLLHSSLLSAFAPVGLATKSSRVAFGIRVDCF